MLRALLRRRSVVAAILVPALLLSLAAGFAAAAPAKVVKTASMERISLFQPLVEATFPATGSPRGLAERLHGLVMEKLRGIDGVEGVVLYRWRPLLIAYNASCGPVSPEPPLQPLIGGFPYTEIVGVEQGGRVCRIAYTFVAVVEPLEGGVAGLEFVSGGPPGPGEVALEERLAEMLGARPGGVVRLLGAEYRVSGVYRWSGGLRLASSEPVAPGVLAGPGVMERLAGSLDSECSRLPAWAAQVAAIPFSQFTVEQPPPPPPGGAGGPPRGVGVLPACSAGEAEMMYAGVVFDAEALASAREPYRVIELASHALEEALREAGVGGYSLSVDPAAVQSTAMIVFNPVMVSLAIPAALLLAGVGYYSAADTAAVVAAEARRLASLLAARGASPRQLGRALLAAMVLASAASSLAAAALAYRMGGLGAAAASALAAPVLLLAARRSISWAASADPREASRPVRGLEAAAPAWLSPGRGRGLALLFAASLVPVAIGLTGLRLEKLLEDAPRWLQALAVTAAVLSISTMPLAPAVVTIYSGLVASEARRVYAAAARLASRLAGPLRHAAEASAARLAPPAAPVVLAVATAFASAAAAGGAAEAAMLASDPDTAAGYAAASRVLMVTAVFSTASALLLLASLYAARLGLVKGEAAVLLARGAPSRMLHGFLAALLLPSGLYAAATGLAAGLAGWAAFRGVSGLYAAFGAGIPPAGFGLREAAATALAVLLGVSSFPAILAYMVARRASPARLLRAARI